MNRSPLAATILLALLTAPAAAFDAGPLTWALDLRRCTSSFSGNGSGTSWQDRAVAYDPFQGGSDIEATNGVETWDTHCIQDSQVDTFGATFSASSDAIIMAGILSGPQSAQSQSKFDVYFTIDASVDYTISGSLLESDHADSFAKVRLTTLAGAVLQNVSSSTDSSRTFHLAGTLEPGTYRLYAEALGKCRTSAPMVFAHGSARCEMTFSATPSPVTPPEDPPPPPPRPTTASSTNTPPPRPS